ncbi:MAG: bifunctional folylpolyglutamate synthase/dihydrofolate synthase [Propionibacteriaceae bacterium]|nr:bifunctional folylpolyglutamate synthase/dihydrofolate synthase [Propionibacteriaceae bacterium]
MSHSTVLGELYRRTPENQVGPSLARISALMELLGDPQHSAPVIQITGTNGKGSTAIIIDALLRAQGLRTGRFTSPHLVDARERICVDGQPIDPQDFDRIYEEIKPMIEMVDARGIDSIPMTFFEVMTALAYACFADAPVDVMVIEVGMGGTWDATTVADASVAVFTPISVDHTDYLGATLEDIAAEKAGIIKENSVVVTAGQQPEVAQVLLAQCARMAVATSKEGVDFSLLDRTMAVGGQVIRLESATGPVGSLFLPLYGSAMAHNAVLAVAAVEALDGMRGLDPSVIEDGFNEVVAPARTELVHGAPPIVVDTCHNPSAVSSTLDTMEEAYGFAPQIVIWAMMEDKDAVQVLKLLEPRSGSLIVTQADTSRAMSAQRLGDLAGDIFGEERVRVCPELADAIDVGVQLADEAGVGAGILIGGSVALAGQARHLLKKGEEKLS